MAHMKMLLLIERFLTLAIAKPKAKAELLDTDKGNPYLQTQKGEHENALLPTVLLSCGLRDVFTVLDCYEVVKKGHTYPVNNFNRKFCTAKI